jgi:hypothetical protein
MSTLDSETRVPGLGLIQRYLEDAVYFTYSAFA